jgi:hypothetical protein
VKVTVFEVDFAHFPEHSTFIVLCRTGPFAPFTGGVTKNIPLGASRLTLPLHPFPVPAVQRVVVLSLKLRRVLSC